MTIAAMRLLTGKSGTASVLEMLQGGRETKLPVRPSARRPRCPWMGLLKVPASGLFGAVILMHRPSFVGPVADGGSEHGSVRVGPEEAYPRGSHPEIGPVSHRGPAGPAAPGLGGTGWRREYEPLSPAWPVR
jgi:hypothetical protein